MFVELLNNSSIGGSPPRPWYYLSRLGGVIPGDVGLDDPRVHDKRILASSPTLFVRHCYPMDSTARICLEWETCIRLRIERSLDDAHGADRGVGFQRGEL